MTIAGSSGHRVETQAESGSNIIFYQTWGSASYLWTKLLLQLSHHKIIPSNSKMSTLSPNHFLNPSGLLVLRFISNMEHRVKESKGTLHPSLSHVSKISESWLRRFSSNMTPSIRRRLRLGNTTTSSFDSGLMSTLPPSCLDCKAKVVALFADNDMRNLSVKSYS